MSPHFKLTLAALAAVALVLLAACSTNARRSHPYRGGDMPHCKGVWVTSDHRTWYCLGHREFQNWRKRNGV